MTAEHHTLFGLRLDEQRRRRAPGRGEATSDITRVAPIAVGAIAACLAALLAWNLAPVKGAAGSSALALPHRVAKLSCDSCHSPTKPAAAACVGCHGPHKSQRPAHQALMASGKLRCVDCHDVHGADQGVRFDGDVTIRYSVGEQRPVESARLGHRATVVFVPLSRCGTCHDLKAASDPIARCAPPDQRASHAPNICFNEHQAWSAVATTRAGGVCSQQHSNSRFAAWEAAAEIVARTPAAPTRDTRGALAWWLGSGAGGGIAAMLLFAFAQTVRRRRRRSTRATPTTAPARNSLPVIDLNTCLGCYACVDACPYDVLTIERYVAVVDQPEACCGLTLCEQVCPNGSLVVADGDPISQRPDLVDGLGARDAPGVFLAGDITGVPLIKNAIVQGAQSIEEIAASLTESHGLPLDLLIVGAGPAGISAALAAKKRGLTYQVVEQGSVAQSIRSFPRGKLVFDQPLELPLAGDLWLEECTKEELLSKWLRTVRQHDLPIDEGQRFTALTSIAGGFEILTESSDDSAEQSTYQAARVLLAIGMRGSPRQLAVDLSDEVESKVFYHLADARTFCDQRILIVGLGDVAMEAAIALARQPGTEVTISYRGEGFRRGKQRNLRELERLVQGGRVRLITSSEVAAIAPTHVQLDTPDGVLELRNDAVFVMIGARPPIELLEAAGVRWGVGAEVLTVSAL